MELPEERQDAFVLPSADASAEEPVVAWEEIEEGRYMPRRVRGSCHGRVLG